MDTISQNQRNDNFREILAWLRGGDTTPNPEMEEKFIDTITGMVIDRMKPSGVAPAASPAGLPQSRPRKDLYKDRPHPLSLTALMREATGDNNYELPKIILNDKPEPQLNVSENEQSDGIDSIILARTLIYLAGINAHPVNQSQIQIILYITYGVYLAEKGRRLTDEHPQMWEYGPVFPKAYNKLRKSHSDGKEEAESLRRLEPEVYKLLEANFRKYAWTSATVLSSPHTASGTPWSETRKKSPDKWGVVIEDSDISTWFTEKISGRK